MTCYIYCTSIHVELIKTTVLTAAVAQWVRAFGCSNPSCDIPKSLNLLVTAPLPNARPKVCVSRVLGHDHDKPMSRVTVLAAQWYNKCRAEVNICRPSPAMVTSPNEGKFSSGTKNSKQTKKTPTVLSHIFICITDLIHVGQGAFSGRI